VLQTPSNAVALRTSWIQCPPLRNHWHVSTNSLPLLTSSIIRLFSLLLLALYLGETISVTSVPKAFATSHILTREENALQVHTRAQARAAAAAQVIADPTPLTLDSDDQTEKSTEISVMTKDPPSTKYGSTHATDEITLHDDLAAHTEFAIARALLRHLVGFVLPPDYKPDLVGEMRVIGVDNNLFDKDQSSFDGKLLGDRVPQRHCNANILH